MKKWNYRQAIAGILLLSGYGCHTGKPAMQSPRDQYPGLFEAVQQSAVFPDSKTFPDCVPKFPAEQIMSAYQPLKDKPILLDSFVKNHFLLPSTPAVVYHSDTNVSVEEHINQLWTVLQRNDSAASRPGSLIDLPHPYVVPGGRFREVYYWDSYFTMLGLKKSGHMDLVNHMLDNFAWLIERFGFIPNGNRSYYLSRSQPPFFALMVDIVARDSTDLAPYRKYAAALKHEYAFWMQTTKENMPGHYVVLQDSIVLNRYYDQGDYPREEAWKEDIATAEESSRPAPVVYRELRSGAESGWDYSSRWLDSSGSLASIHTTDILPVDLNCLLYHLEKTLVKVYTATNEPKQARLMEKLAAARKNAIQQLMWDKQDGFYHDYNWKKQRRTPSVHAAAMFPFYFEIARQGQADSAFSLLKLQLLKDGGIQTTSVQTGQQWDAPNGWAPLQWVAISALCHYGYKQLAMEISNRWTTLNRNVYKRTGKLLEKYNVADTSLTGGGGEYPNQDGFGWTNGVFLMLSDER